MTFATLLPLLVTYGQPISLVAMKVIEAIAAGRANDTPTTADITELNRLAALDSAAIYARQGITPPPAALDSAAIYAQQGITPLPAAL